MATENKAVRSVIEVLHDGEKGFQSLGEMLKNPVAQSFFMEESVTRGEFAEELETVLGAVTDMNVTEGGTASGTMRRMWGELKGSMGGGDHALLATAEQGEDTTKKAYDEALKSNDVPAPIHLLLLQQQTHILAAHDKVRAMRDSIAA